MNNRKWEELFSTDLRLRYNSKSTHNTYLRAVHLFLQRFKHYREPKEIPNLNIKKYLLGFKSHNSRKQAHCAIARFYEMALGMPDKIKRIPYPKKIKSLPKVNRQR